MSRKINKPSTLEAFEHRGSYIYVRFNDFSEIDLELAFEQGMAYEQIVNGYRMPFLFDARNQLLKFTHEAREFIARNSTVIVIAEAFVASEAETLMHANFFKKYHHPEFPFKVFKDFEEAESWIKTFSPEKIKT